MSVLTKVTERLKQALEEAIEQTDLVAADSLPEVMLDIPREKAHGDFSTNIAMQLTRIAKKNPREIAEQIVSSLDLEKAGVDRVEIAGPGFINFFTSKAYLRDVIVEVLKAGERFGSSQLGNQERIQVEFVSANPTGSLHLGHARGAAIGDALCNLLEFAGYDVSREYYINDAGNQIDNLARSLEARYLQALGQEAEMPEDGYYGEDIKQFAAELAAEEGDRLTQLPEEERFQFFKQYGLKRELAKIKADLERFRVRFDRWFSETSLYEDGKVTAALEALQEKGSTYESEGATWLAATKFGDDKDRVLVKQDGSYTYLLPDIAYHIDKFNRGFSRLINIWGADHHGYIPRLKAAMLSLGYEAERLEVLIAQMVNLYQDGERVKMSKRTGKAVTMEELMDEVGIDAVRYFFTMRSMDSHLDFDMDLAVSKSNENPVYYVQYAHARICSLFRQAEEMGVKIPTLEDANQEVLAALNKEAEYDLLQKIAEWPEEVETAASQLAPHRLVRYVYELASLFHSYYRAERIIVEDEKEQQAKLLFISAIQIVIQNVLRLIGVSVPERM